MYKILKAEKLAEKIYLMDVLAPRVAKHCQPGQFVIVKMDEKIILQLFWLKYRPNTYSRIRMDTSGKKDYK